MTDYLSWSPQQEQDRWLRNKHPDGVLELDDGSLWGASVRDHGKVASWVRFSCITVRRDSIARSEYPYSLMNTSYDQQIRVKYLGNVAERKKSGAA